jgi:hypothetical protein
VRERDHGGDHCNDVVSCNILAMKVTSILRTCTGSRARVTQRRITSAEIVDRDLDAEIVNSAQLLTLVSTSFMITLSGDLDVEGRFRPRR